jgi:hypothetical protein
MKDYSRVIKKLAEAHNELKKIGERDIFSKGGIGEIILAHHLKHNLWSKDKGPDAYDRKSRKFEYKVSMTNKFVFHFGSRSKKKTVDEQVWQRFEGVAGTYCAEREGTEVVQLFYIPTEQVVPMLIRYFKKRRIFGQMQKSYTCATLKRLGYEISTTKHRLT